MLISPKASGENGVDIIALKRGRKMAQLSGCGVAVARLLQSSSVTLPCFTSSRVLYILVEDCSQKSLHQALYLYESLLNNISNIIPTIHGTLETDF